jgi:hypothetical protein
MCDHPCTLADREHAQIPDIARRAPEQHWLVASGKPVLERLLCLTRAWMCWALQHHAL